MASLVLAAYDRIQQWRGIQTNIDRHHCTRIVPMRVLVLGFSRTGTTSIRQALHELGIHDVYHADAFYHFNPPDAEMWVEAFEGKFGNGRKYTRDDWDKLLGHCMAVSDAPIVPHFDEDIIELYPEAKIVLSLRDSPEQWWRSYRDTLIPFAKQLLPNSSLANRVYRFFLPRLAFDEYHKWLMQRSGSLEKVQELGPEIYVWHNQRIRDLVAEKRGAHALQTDLLEFNVKQGYGPLCKFLDIAPPLSEQGEKKPFPYANDTADFKRIAKDLQSLMDFLVGVNVMFTVSTVGLAAYLLQWYMARS